MARRTDVNLEPYAGFIAQSQIPQCNPKNMFYTTNSKCKRYYCAVCGDCHPVNTQCTQRITEWLTGTTLPDALHRASEAYVIDEYTQLRFKQARASNKNDPCVIAEHIYNSEQSIRNQLKPC